MIRRNDLKTRRKSIHILATAHPGNPLMWKQVRQAIGKESYISISFQPPELLTNIKIDDEHSLSITLGYQHPGHNLRASACLLLHPPSSPSNANQNVPMVPMLRPLMSYREGAATRVGESASRVVGFPSILPTARLENQISIRRPKCDS